MGSGKIWVEVDVGTGAHCPIGGSMCPGQNWESKDFCALFGKALVRDRTVKGRRHRYLRCGECLDASRTQQEPEPLIETVYRDLNVFRCSGEAGR